MILFKTTVSIVLPPLTPIATAAVPALDEPARMVPLSIARAPQAAPALPAAIQSAVWRAAALSELAQPVVSSGWPQLDAQLPGGGWPCSAVCEVLVPQFSVLEWRLLGPCLHHVVANGGQVVVVGPPHEPYLPGLLHQGFDERRFVWVAAAEASAERLWAAEQLIKAHACRALVAWLPEARPQQVRRLQVAALGGKSLVFLCRPQAAQHEPSAAPLRVQATLGLDWELHLRIVKRHGPPFEGVLRLPSVPGGLASVLTPRLRRPSRFFHPEVPADVVGRTAVSVALRRPAAAHAHAF